MLTMITRLMICWCISFTAFSKDNFQIDLFNMKFDVPASYYVNPYGYGEHSKVRLLYKGDEWREVSVYSISYCNGNCVRHVKESALFSVRKIDKYNDITYIKAFFVEGGLKTEVDFFCDDEIVVQIVSAPELSKLWVDKISGY